ncbi:MAG: membrane protein insertion efficiency factor YidD [Terriglobales bacterium]
MQALLLAGLRGYKRFISPTQPASCRFVPSCAEYAAEAIAHHGAFFGTMLAAWRLLRCNPFSRGGLDLVPHKSHSHNQSQAAQCSPAEHTGRSCS